MTDPIPSSRQIGTPALERPNIILLTTDQHRFDALGSAGDPCIHTPHLDWLADSGTRFTRAYSTAPVCGPARETIMTGKHWHENQRASEKSGRPAMADIETLPARLTDAGYQTRAIGKMHFHPVRAHYGFEHVELPMDYIREMRRTAPGLPELGDQGLGQNEMAPAISPLREEQTLTHWTVRRSVDFLETRDPTRPFFLWTSFTKPHPPLDPLEAYWLLYENAEWPDPVCGDWSAEWNEIPAALRASTIRLSRSDRRSPSQWKAAKRAYYALITQIDYNLGLLFARLRELDLLGNTWILFTSDHGEMLGDHGLSAKGIFLEASAHVPLILRPPGYWDSGEGVEEGSEYSRGGTDDRLACLADIFPTILARTGVDSQPEDSARAGLDLIGPEKHPYLVGEYQGLFMVRRGRYKLQWISTGGEFQLFDLQDDPYERKNIYADPAHAEERSQMEKILKGHLREYASDLLQGNDFQAAPTPDLSVLSSRRLWPGFHSSKANVDVFH